MKKIALLLFIVGSVMVMVTSFIKIQAEQSANNSQLMLLGAGLTFAGIILFCIELYKTKYNNN